MNSIFRFYITDYSDVSENKWISDESIVFLEEKFEKSGKKESNNVQFMSLNETQIQLNYRDNKLYNVNVNLNLDRITSYDLEHVIEFISINNCMMLMPYGNAYTPIKETLVELIKESDEYREFKNKDELIKRINQ